MPEDREAYIVYFKRTAFSRVKREDPKFDVFYDMSGPTLFSKLLVRAVEDLGIKPDTIDHMIVGNALQGGDNWSMGGRIPVFLAKFPVHIPAMAVDMQCASSFDAIGIGAMEIWTGQADIVFAGGYEHLSRVPMYNNPYILPHMELVTNPEYAMYDMATGYVMGLTAEKLAAIKGIGREEMDRWSLRSHMLATKAYEEGYFKDEILPIEVVKDGQKVIVDKDLSVRPNTSMEALAKLPPAFKPGGVITAGNSAPLNSGASLVVLMSGRKVRELGVKPLARIVSLGWAAVDPSIMGEGPVPASRKALAKAGLRVEDIDLWEINEAFAVVTLNAIKELGIDENRVNVKGGAIAIGHPLGATGARLVGTLARQLQLYGKEYGLATACVGGGQGYAVILQRP
ncbi:acetyl-CoA acetyltransferase [Vulcanisaeta sp. EB80]|uniref:acetyl-CoA C-acetyltransferase n=1 Tax=Vulcanisaeta sp. EB80 TaxID=1650660 RepID=UPI0009BF924F|nr:acetyl-CoA C-acetyltransferase [Vulcanisaeta sp. EB80]PLC67662.1 acetyl-CoA acetyltransferase [Vulcanisaeta sp. EB80]